MRYNDIQLARITLKHVEIAHELAVKKIVVRECDHASKAISVVTDRIFSDETYTPRESCFPLLRGIVFNEVIKLDTKKNDFPVTLHDPCNLVRMMGIVEPQREILRNMSSILRNDSVGNKCFCVPCSNCKGQFRDIFDSYNVQHKSGISYGDLADLIVNAVVVLRGPWLTWEL